MTKPPRVLMVEDQSLVAATLEIQLGKEFAVRHVADGQAAVEILAAEPDDAFDVVLCDVEMPRLDGLGVLLWARLERPSLLQRLLFMTANPEVPQARAIARSHMHPLLVKPCTRATLLDAIRALG